MREILTSPRVIDLRRKQKRGRIRLAILLSIFVISLIGGLAYFSAHPRVTIQTIEVIGTEIINAPEVEKEVRDMLTGRYFYLFSRANTFLYPRESMYVHLLDAFPRIESLAVDRTGMNTVRITIVERIGSHLYCGITPQNEIDEVCYFINDDGYIFDHAPYFSGDLYFKFYGPLTDDGVTPSDGSPLGRHMLLVDRFHELVRFMNGLESIGFNPVGLSMGTDGNNTITLFSDTGVGHPVVMFRNDNDLEEILENLSASMKKPEFRGEIQSKYSTLLYVDLRFTNKVLYKFRE